VLVHARALLSSRAEGANAYIDADLREPERILSHPDLTRTLDLSQPVGLMLVAIMHFVLDNDKPYQCVARLVDAMPAGSYLAMSHFTMDYMPPETFADLHRVGNVNAVPGRSRSRAEFARFFDGLELQDPGVVPVAEWRAQNEPQPRPPAEDVAIYAAVARIP
jgi:hypothetical protein